MKIDPRTEVCVFAVVKDEGESDRSHILERLKEQHQITLSESDLKRYLYKWKGSRVMVVGTREGVEVWRIASVPPWYVSATMDLLSTKSNPDIKSELNLLAIRLKDDGPITNTKRKWGDFRTINVVFESLDGILGGRTIEDGDSLILPRVGDKIQIPPSMFKAMIRDNEALMEISGMLDHMGISPGEILENPKPFFTTLPVKDVGLVKYEGLPAGTQFGVTLRIPCRGTPSIKSITDFKKLLDLIAIAPIRGFGANPYAHGGRIKPVKIEELN
jgi:hypothetical protein